MKVQLFNSVIIFGTGTKQAKREKKQKNRIQQLKFLANKANENVSLEAFISLNFVPASFWVIELQNNQNSPDQEPTNDGTNEELAESGGV